MLFSMQGYFSFHGSLVYLLFLWDLDSLDTSLVSQSCIPVLGHNIKHVEKTQPFSGKCTMIVSILKGVPWVQVFTHSCDSNWRHFWWQEMGLGHREVSLGHVLLPALCRSHLRGYQYLKSGIYRKLLSWDPEAAWNICQKDVCFFWERGGVIESQILNSSKKPFLSVRAKKP